MPAAIPAPAALGRMLSGMGKNQKAHAGARLDDGAMVDRM